MRLINKRSIISALAAFCAIVAFVSPTLNAAEKSSLKSGSVHYVPAADEESIPSRFRLSAHQFEYTEELRPKVSDRIQISHVTFPSPVQTDVAENNTVHCEYYRPNVEGKEGKHPAVIVLHILGGDFPLARVFSNAIAQRGVGALFLKMPYYGPRRGANSQKRMITPDPRETVEGMTQAILDIRQAAAFLSAREEVDSSQLGIFGISLGGITGALALTAEPRLKNGCFLLAGGDMGQVAWQGKELAETRELWTKSGGTKEAFFEIMKVIDPAVYASNAQSRRILMLNAMEDEVIPRACTESLWRAFGQPEIVWYDGGHYSVARHLLDAMKRTQDFFAASTMSTVGK
jgi:dienelactone hydrolase